MLFCKYSDIFGKPKKGVHSYRLFGVAIVDFGLTILIGILIGLYFNYYIPYVCLILLALGVLFHYLFCVKTTFNRLLGLA